MSSFVKISTLMTGLLLSVGCTTPPVQDLYDLMHHNWRLVQVNGEPVKFHPHKEWPRLEIGENGKANGYAGCNHFFGQAEILDAQIRLNQMGSTKMLCHGHAMAVEDAMLAVLSDWSSLTISDNSITLENGDTKLRFQRRDSVN